ncbi:hypothetical protein M2418_003683 [Rhizobium sp. BIGb0125]|nr:hypothetical protein [Rhizobium sp. BIGb0125]
MDRVCVGEAVLASSVRVTDNFRSPDYWIFFVRRYNRLLTNVNHNAVETTR